MAPHYDTLHEKTLNNENLAGSEPHVTSGHNHHDLHDRTHMNENLTAPTPRMDSEAPIEKDFSNNGMH
jgi:hypothetical protein